MKNKKQFLIIIFITILTISAFSILYGKNYNKKDENVTVNDKLLISASDPVNLVWNHSWLDYNGALGNAIGLDSLNNTYTTGYTNSISDSWEVFLLKYNSSGQLQWDLTWGRGGLLRDVGEAIQISSTNDIYVAGYTENVHAGERDIFLLKYNNAGALQWYDVWGGGGYETCYGIAIDTNDNIFLAGVTESWIVGGTAMFLLKYNTSGGLEWNRTWGGGILDGAMGIVVDSSDNIYLGGTIDSDMCLVKFDNSGVWQWNRSENIVGVRYCKDITIDSLDNIYLIGEGIIFDNTSFISKSCLFKYDKFGVLQWSRARNTTTGSSSQLLFNGMSLDPSNNIYLAKRTTDDNMEIEKFDSSGNKKWDYVFGSTGDDSLNGIVIDTLNNIYVVGDLNFETYIAKFIENTPETLIPEIPGYNLWMLICVLSVVSSVIAISMSIKIKLSKKIE
jgi:predicted secreted protein